MSDTKKIQHTPEWKRAKRIARAERRVLRAAVRWRASRTARVALTTPYLAFANACEELMRSLDALTRARMGKR